VRADLLKRALEGCDLLGGHARVLVGEAEVQLGPQVGGRSMRAFGGIGDEAAGMERGERRDPIGVGCRDPPAETPAHAVAGDGDRPGRRHLPETLEVGRPVGGEPLGGELLDQGLNRLEDARALFAIG
jgi:hypothetical protein